MVCFMDYRYPQPHARTLQSRTGLAAAGRFSLPAGAGRADSGLNRRGWPNLAARGMSFNICRGTLGSLAMFTAIRNAYHLAGMKMNIARQGPDWRSS